MNTEDETDVRQSSESPFNFRPMSVTEAMATRMTCRAFKSNPVSEHTIRSILAAASRTPSGGNLQPWRVWVLSGDALDRLESIVREKLAAGEFAEVPTEHLIYPETLQEPYVSRKFRAGAIMFEAIGVVADDTTGWMNQMRRNFEFFGAPAALFFAIDRAMQQGQWAELGMFMQAIMLLAREFGLDTAPIGAWALRHITVRQFLEMPDELMLYCGMGIGVRDDLHPINQIRSERAPLEEFAVFRGF